MWYLIKVFYVEIRAFLVNRRACLHISCGKPWKLGPDNNMIGNMMFTVPL